MAILRSFSRVLGGFSLMTALLYTPPLATQPSAGKALSINPDTARIINEFRDFVERDLLDYTPGLALAIVETGRPSYIDTYGVRRLGGSQRITQHTPFRIASLSKAFAAATAGIMVREGELSWDGKLSSYLPEITLKDPARQQAISVRHILSNSTGLMPHTYTNLIEDNVPYESILERLDQVDFVCNPGNCYTYQNVVYSVIGDIMQRATGKDYPSLVREKIFTPLEMADASVSLEEFINRDYAVPHERRRRVLRPTRVEENYYQVAPAAGVNASISDMEHWLRALLGDRPDVLPPDVLSDLFSTQTPVSRNGYSRGPWKNVRAAWYGLGWRVFDYGGQQVIYHSGWVRGYRAEIVLIPSRGLGMALLMNSDHVNGNAAAPRFVDITLGLSGSRG